MRVTNTLLGSVLGKVIYLVLVDTLVTFPLSRENCCRQQFSLSAVALALVPLA
jgi:hypothetical protein